MFRLRPSTVRVPRIQSWAYLGKGAQLRVELDIPAIEQGVMLRQSQPDVEMFDDLVLFNDANGEMYACLMRLGQFSMFVHHSVLAGREDA